MWLILVLVLFHVIYSSDAHLYKANPGKRRQDVDLWTGVVDVPGKCATLCLMNNDCWSFNVMMNNNAEVTCQLNGGHSQAILSDEPQAFYYGERHFFTIVINNRSLAYVYMIWYWGPLI